MPVWAQGVTINFDKFRLHGKLRFLFFEIDTDNPEQYHRIKRTYIENHLDLVTHPTHLGWHFLSPTVINPAEWRKIIDSLHDINQACPMITLRIHYGKYGRESEKNWYKGKLEASFGNYNAARNSIEMVELLKAYLPKGEIIPAKLKGELEFVNYKLPPECWPL